MRLPLLAMTGLVLSACSQAKDSAPVPDYPASLKALAGQGIKITGHLPAPSGFKGYLGNFRGHPMPVYLLPDGKHVVIGSIYDAQGKDLTSAAFRTAIMPKLGMDAWNELARASWVAEGSEHPKRIVYVFTDTECPYCHRFWQASQAYLKQGDVQLRNIVVAVIAPTSLGRGAAVLAAKDPKAALRQHQQSFGHSSLVPLTTIPGHIRGKIENNAALMDRLGLDGTPALVYQDEQGQVRVISGMPPAAVMQQIFGKR